LAELEAKKKLRRFASFTTNQTQRFFLQNFEVCSIEEQKVSNPAMKQVNYLMPWKKIIKNFHPRSRVLFYANEPFLNGLFFMIISSVISQKNTAKIEP